ncbi:MAG: hypothetical protein KDA24_28800, partial [Deltaproteobacteria bacterium]|nr:hypothetical protein [Deltaproteobacteria bacterium]
MTRSASLLAAASLVVGCPSSADSPDETPSRGLPEGSSTWSGTGEANGFSFLVEFELVNTNGDLAGTATVADDPDDPFGLGEGSFSVIGTHAPESGKLAFAPTGWLQSPVLPIELLGATGLYDIDDGTITGQLRDWSDQADNTLRGGALNLTMSDGGGDPTPIGDEGESLADGSQEFSGTLQCTGPVRDVEGTLT